MEYNNIFQRVKDTAKVVATAYVLLGSIYMMGKPVTGHPSADDYLARNPDKIEQRETTGHLSADIHLGISQPKKLEKLILDR